MTSIALQRVTNLVAEFREASKNRSQHIASDLASHGRRKVVIRLMPTASGTALCFFKKSIAIEVEDIDPGAFNDFAESQNTDPESQKMSAIMDALTASSLSPLDPYRHCYLNAPDAIANMRASGSTLYRISEESLRFLKERLLRWSLEDLCFRSQYPPLTDEDALDFFLLAFVKHGFSHGMVSIVCAGESGLISTR